MADFANVSGPLTVAEMQAIRLAITEERIFKMFLVLSTHALFIYINIVMLLKLRTKPMFHETARYILFAHMLLNDTIHLVVGLVFSLLGAFYWVMVRAACAFILLMSAFTFVNAPLNLAVMTLERYTVICFPLRHSELATAVRSRVAVVVWALGTFNVLTDVFALFLAETSFYLSPTLCSVDQLLVAPWQRVKGVVFNVLLFVTVAAVLLYTYVAILRQARTASADHSSVQKALRTVLLHALQLGLLLMSFLYVYLESLLADMPLSVYTQIRFLNFIMVLILPHCLSSLIYGLRDETFRPLFRQCFLSCNIKKVGPLYTFRESLIK